MPEHYRLSLGQSKPRLSGGTVCSLIERYEADWTAFGDDAASSSTLDQSDFPKESSPSTTLTSGREDAQGSRRVGQRRQPEGSSCWKQTLVQADATRAAALELSKKTQEGNARLLHELQAPPFAQKKEASQKAAADRPPARLLGQRLNGEGPRDRLDKVQSTSNKINLQPQPQAPMQPAGSTGSRSARPPIPPDWGQGRSTDRRQAWLDAAPRPRCSSRETTPRPADAPSTTCINGLQACHGGQSASPSLMSSRGSQITTTQQTAVPVVAPATVPAWPSLTPGFTSTATTAAPLSAMPPQRSPIARGKIPGATLTAPPGPPTMTASLAATTVLSARGLSLGPPARAASSWTPPLAASAPAVQQIARSSSWVPPGMIGGLATAPAQVTAVPAWRGLGLGPGLGPSQPAPSGATLTTVYGTPPPAWATVVAPASARAPATSASRVLHQGLAKSASLETLPRRTCVQEEFAQQAMAEAPANAPPSTMEAAIRRSSASVSARRRPARTGWCA